MTVKEFVDVVNNAVISYSEIYEEYWNEDFKSYDTKVTDKKARSKEDLKPYYDYELDNFEMEFSYGEWANSRIYIKMPKEQDTDYGHREI